MPLTAYSNQFQGEFDVIQLLKLLDPTRPDSYDTLEISAPLRQIISETVVCPGCGAGNPSVVVTGQSKSASKRKVSQAHFRFDTHKPFCDFELDPNSSRLPDHLIDFRSSRSALTKLVAERVSKGIHLGIFDQATMRNMRQWFVDVRISNSYRCDIDIELAEELFRLPYNFYTHIPSFTPAMSKLPEFNPNEFGNQRFVEENPDIYEVFDRYRGTLHFMHQHKGAIRAAVNRYRGRLVFNPTACAVEYAQTSQLLHFVVKHERSVRWPPKFFHDERSSLYSLLSAFCALLLFSANGDMERAVESYVAIRTSSASASALEGNIIGLNPFFDQEIWLFIAAAHEVRALRPNGLIVHNRIEEIRKELVSKVFPAR